MYCQCNENNDQQSYLVIPLRKTSEFELANQMITALFAIGSRSVNADIEGFVGCLYIDFNQLNRSPLGKVPLVNKSPVSGIFYLVLADVFHSKGHQLVREASFSKGVGDCNHKIYLK